jgi:geranylgeranyl pyrophosphate synthase
MDAQPAQVSPAAAATQAWAAARTAEIVARAEAFALSIAPTPEFDALLRTALSGLRERAQSADVRFFFHLPLLVHAGIRGTDEPAVPVAVATRLLFLGIDIGDDLADGDLPAHWVGYRPSEINLAALTLLASVPQLAIAQLDAPTATREAMRAAIAGGLLRMAGGQQADRHTAGATDVSAAAVEASVVAKTGEEIALFARLGAECAGAARAQVERYAALGRWLGTAYQVASDLYDLFHAAHSKDLANGTRTLPIVQALERLPGPARTDLLAQLDRARRGEPVRKRILEHLLAAGVPRRCGLTVEVYLQRARLLLDELSPHEPASTRLRALIQELSHASDVPVAA